jgi:hypothetical protein
MGHIRDRFGVGLRSSRTRQILTRGTQRQGQRQHQRQQTVPGSGTVSGIRPRPRPRSPVTVTVTDEAAPHPRNSTTGTAAGTASASSRGPLRSRLRWILGGVGFQPAHEPSAFGETAARRAGCPPHHGKQRLGQLQLQRQQTASAAGTATATADSVGARDGFRNPDTATVPGHGDGHGRGRSSPEKLNDRDSGRDSGSEQRGARYGLDCDGFLVAWASSPRMNRRLSE